MNPTGRHSFACFAAAALVLGPAAHLALVLFSGRPAAEPSAAPGPSPARGAPEAPDMSKPIRSHDCTFYVNPRDPVHSRILFLTGLWEEDQVEIFLAQIKSGDTVVDLGANIGFYTVLGAKAVGPSGRVYSFEPDPESIGFLRRNVAANGFTNVTAEQKALSNVPGKIKLYLSKENLGDHRTTQVGRRDFIEVEAIRFDDYFGPAAPRIDLIKIDTQGAEIGILQGMAETFKRSPQVKLLVEFWPGGLRQFGHDPVQMLNLLRGYGFKFRDIKDRGTAETSSEELMSRYGESGWANLYCWR